MSMGLLQAKLAHLSSTHLGHYHNRERNGNITLACEVGELTLRKRAALPKAAATFSRLHSLAPFPSPCLVTTQDQGELQHRRAVVMTKPRGQGANNPKWPCIKASDLCQALKGKAAEQGTLAFYNVQTSRGKRHCHTGQLGDQVS